MKQRVLIVEDEEKLRRVVQLQLQVRRLRCRSGRVGRGGMRSADRADLIITDLKLPGMDGLQFIAIAPTPEFSYSGHRDHCFRFGGNGGRGDEVRSRGFRDEAVFPRPSVDRGPKSPCSPRLARGEYPAARGTRCPLRVRQHHRPKPRDAGDLRDDRRAWRRRARQSCWPAKAAWARI